MKRRIVLLLMLSMIFNQSIVVFGNNDMVCSKWAAGEISTAIGYELVPEDLQCSYTESITREEFCVLIINMLNKVSDKITVGTVNNSITYSDTAKDEVISASALGIVSGVGNNKFNPNGNITRQEASRMLYMSSTIGKRYTNLQEYFSDKVNQMNNEVIMPHIFRDGYKIQSWAHLSINYCYMYGIMQGNDNNMFDVDGTYSREQSIVTILRLYNLLKYGNINIPDREYLYAKKSVKGDSATWGYIDEKNQWIIKPNYENIIYQANPFEGNYTMIDLGSASGLRVINKNGAVVHTGYTHGVRFGNIVSFENDNGTTNLETGEIIGNPVFTMDKNISGIGETLIPIQDNKTGLYGYYNSDGKRIIPNKYDMAYTFCNGKAIVQENGSYKLIDRFGTVIKNFNPALNKTEYIEYAIGDLYIVRENIEYSNSCKAGKADKGIILKSDKNIAYAMLLINGDIFVENTDNTFSIYNNDGKHVFSSNRLLEYNSAANIYFALYVSDGVRNDKILTRNGNEIITIDYNKYGIIGNGLFCTFKDNQITVYDNTKNVISQISTANSVSEIYCDNGVIFVTDVNNNFSGYTYMGEKII